MRKVPSNQIPENFYNNKVMKVLFFAFIGHFLELYDYTIYVVMLTIISPMFFPSSSIAGSVSLGLLSFAFSLLIMPLAAWFWGWYGDKHGRLPMLKHSIMLMALPSLIIAILPTYQEIGIFAPSILIGCRFLQTFSASGEVSGAKIFAMEHLGKNNLGKISGLLSCGAGLGVLLAMGMGLLLSNTCLSWRLPFFLGSSLAIVGIMIRRKVAESPEFIKLMQKQHSDVLSISSTFSMLKAHKTQAIVVIVLGAMLGVLSYMMHAFLNPYIISLGYANNVAYRMGVVGLAACGLASIITGVIIDRLLSAKTIMLSNIASCVVLIPFTFILMLLSVTSYNEFLLYLAFIIQGILLGINATTSSVIMYQLFKPENRCRGVMICYGIGMAIFGGFTPIILHLSTKFGNFSPAIIVSIFVILAYFVYKKNIGKIYDAVP